MLPRWEALWRSQMNHVEHKNVQIMIKDNEKNESLLIYITLLYNKKYQDFYLTITHRSFLP